MDLNTGTPIQPPNSQLPPLPQQSEGIPMVTPPVTPQSNVPVVAPPTADLPTVSQPVPPPPAQAPVPNFLDPLAMLKQMTSGTGTAPQQPSQPQSPPPQVTTSAPIAQEQPMQVSEVGASNIPVQPLAQATQVAPSLPVVTDMPDVSTPTPSTPLPQGASAAMSTLSFSGQYTTKGLLDLVAQKDASDLHLVVGYAPMIRIDGELVLVGSQIVTPQMAKELIYAVLPDDKKEQLEVNREVDLAYQHEMGRFRINAYWQRGYLSAAFRLIPTRIRTIDELKLPNLFHKFTDLEQGLVLVTGPTGHGKSTTLAAVIQEINMKFPKHILTIEDPIEYVFPQQKALVSQRELGDDTHSWKGALRSALREDPDVVLVGEMRDLETISSAITVAETGHLVFATLHTNNAAQTIQRIVNMYPDVQQDEIRSELADVLEAVVAQRLIPIKGGGRRAALEIMLMTPAIRNLIRENKIFQIDNIIRTSLDVGMVTLERSLLELYKEGLISQEDVLRYALDPTEMARLLEELV